MTITVTEAGYLRGADGRLDADRDVVASDVAALQQDRIAPVASLPAKLVAGLLARRAAGAGPITLLSCDNLPHNGPVTEAVVRDLAERGRRHPARLDRRPGRLRDVDGGPDHPGHDRR